MYHSSHALEIMKKDSAMTATLHHEPEVHALDLFPASEWAAFRQADTKAATAIVVLMVGIFVTGIVLYAIVLATL
jgi:hypothetical protein